MKYLVAILALLLCLAAPAGAEAPACTGKDILAEMRKSDPTAYAALRAEADAIPEWPRTLLEDRTTQWHSAVLSLRNRACDRSARACLRARVQAALDKASTVIVESTEALNSTEMAKHMFKVAGPHGLAGNADA